MMRALWRRVLELVWTRRLDRESAEELAHHFDTLVDEKRRAGLDEEDARRHARRELGSVDHAREQLAESRSGFQLEQLWREALYAIRVLRRAPGITLLSVATMGVGIGVSTILFALVSSILLRPLPYEHPEQLVRIFDTNPQLGVERAGAASGNIDDWRRRSSRFDGIAGFYSTGRTLSSDTDAEVVITAQVSQRLLSDSRRGAAPRAHVQRGRDPPRAVQQRGRADRSGSGGRHLLSALAATLRRRSRRSSAGPSCWSAVPSGSSA